MFYHSHFTDEESRLKEATSQVTGHKVVELGCELSFSRYGLSCSPLL